MSPYEWFSAAQAVAMLAAGVILWLLLRGFQSGRYIQGREDDLNTVTTRVGKLELRMDQAGDEMSALATSVQAMPETLRGVFVPRDVFAEISGQVKEDRLDLRRNIERLWEVIRIGKVAKP